MANVTHYSVHYMSESSEPWITDINCSTSRVVTQAARALPRFDSSTALFQRAELSTESRW